MTRCGKLIALANTGSATAPMGWEMPQSKDILTCYTPMDLCHIYPGIRDSCNWCSLQPGNELHAPSLCTKLLLHLFPRHITGKHIIDIL